ncbi:hypothetical protein SCMU_29410 [Sinomonas cyclohexanicum]|uniref:Alpha/beta hydrolase n=1 Tax=Sinomonas cyclohexanicum TaxID=322009 RepID=A0ABN6FJX4_SINCY|nr:hypothetical protein [Corynebacterium cyclohexanicum]BCT77099.1 hypothetical protein SCMU_29410 [Corynebacterium cyclohexanicum]
MASQERPAHADSDTSWWVRHVIGIGGHEFAGSGPAATTAKQVDAIFRLHLPRFQRERGGLVPIVFWAHGGLVNRGYAFGDALRAIPWWLANGIYPVYFVWDTGLVSTLNEVLAERLAHWMGSWRHSDGPDGGGAPPAGYGTQGEPTAEGDTADVVRVPGPSTTDGIVTDGAATRRDRIFDDVIRLVDGRGLWEQMKDDARDVSLVDGGAGRYVAERVDAFVRANPGTALHAVGHSAGAQFQSAFVSELVRRGLTLQTVQFLAPAMSIRQFTEEFMPLMESAAVRAFTMFSLGRETAQRDRLLGLYEEGSMLHFILNALEPDDGGGLLGLQECVEPSPLARWFGTDPDAGPVGAVWSVAMGSPRSSSGATTHSSFTHDVLTLDSMCRRILGRDDILSAGVFSGDAEIAFAVAHDDFLRRLRRRL